jgi:predicted PurR-regulated permease PerM
VAGLDMSARSQLDRGNEPARQSTAEVLVIIAICVAALYAGSALFIPLALAILLAFALTPAVKYLRRLSVPKVPATMLVVVLFLASVIAIGTVITSQVTTLVTDLPKYEQTLRDKISSLKSIGFAPGTMDRASETIKQLQNEIEQEAPSQVPVAPPVLDSSNARQPVPVEIKEGPMTPLQQVSAVLGALLSPFATIGVVLLFLVFILLEREDFRDRFIRVLGTEDLERSTTTLNETGGRLSKYLFTLTLLNAGFGVVIGLGLWIIGVPSPALWGLVAGLMRFVPFVGSFIAAGFPLILAASVDPGWTMFALTLGLFLITEPLMGHVIEPVIQGRVTGLSTLAILVSTAFWTLLWGPIGLLLALPLTLVLVSIGRHLEPFAFFNLLLGDQPALSQQEAFYQRILTGATDDAVEQALDQIEDGETAKYYDTVVRGALTMAARDVDRNRFTDERMTEIGETTKEIIDLLDDELPESGAEGLKPNVVCIGARTAIDDAGAHAVASLLISRGVSAEVVALRNWRSVAELAPEVICVGSFSSRYRLQYAIRNATRAWPKARIIGGWWGAVDGQSPNEPGVPLSKIAEVVGSFEATVDACLKYVEPVEKADDGKKDDAKPDEKAVVAA